MSLDIAQRIKSRRKAQGLSQEALADACGVGQSTVANWEGGGHIPRQASLKKIASALDTDEVWLLSGEQTDIRESLNAYLMRPIRHMPVYDWTQHAQQREEAQPNSYIPVTSEHEALFALTSNSAIGNFAAGTVLVFSRVYDAEKYGHFLTLNGGSYILSDTHSENSTARLAFSLASH